MKQRGRKPNPLHGRGEVRADSLYPLSVLCRRLGIGRNTLTSMRRRGLPVHNLGRRCSFIFGSELLDFLKANPDQGSNNATADAEKCGDSAATVPVSVPGGRADGI
jgi:hypothetical protein